MTHHTPAGAAVEDCGDDKRLEMISCEICMKEIPASAAKNVEATGYVHYFCGLDCLADWQKQNSK